ncbi:MAG: type secretion system secreted protein Hcp [Acidobacteriota bacterium]|jgi:type VI secretion system secreted protein Hcp|nr:type secretion system secreted protein Hcp [Acidobacteriota bacterium]
MASNTYVELSGPAIAPFEILSWSHGFVQPTSASRSTAGGGTIEQATHQNLSFTKYLDNNTSALIRACWSGKQFQKAILTASRTDNGGKPVKYLTVTMEHVIVSNYSVSGGPGDQPVENYSLDYGIITYEYTAKGQSDSATHDLVQRTIA